MKNILLKFILIFVDLIAIFISIALAVTIRKAINLFIDVPEVGYFYTNLRSIYAIQIISFIFLGIYRKRYDFWHETHLIIKGSFLSFIILLAGLALNQNVDIYSRSTLFLAFLFSIFVIPLFKYTAKIFLFKLGFWERKVKIITENENFISEIFSNPYLGYVKSNSSNYDTLFINGTGMGTEKLNKIIEENIRYNRDVIFTPVLSEYDFSKMYICNLFNSRMNIFILDNKLLLISSKIIKFLFDYLITVLSFPFWGLVCLVVAIAIKLEEKKGQLFFKQKRLGIDGKEFTCYKFRTMFEEQSFMAAWLDEHPEEKQYYDIYHKYVNDPRITRIGAFLRKTSLDELPQLFNVLKGDMSLIGPRPYMVNEKDSMGDSMMLVLSMKPGITGLWQVSGRSETKFP
uniref:Glucosyl transferase n=1 Tax=Aggregatibacter actinomycetemcomitans TaxID=714 RepID=Q9JRR6_AGGAC|nr:glucosyl transferase [Aggregatibacter actinomycetemcomitans]